MTPFNMPSNNDNQADLQRLHVAWKTYVAGDYAAAMREFSGLAEKGHSRAWLYLGWLHNKGLGTPINYSKAEVCYKNAISLGNVDALIPLGRLYKKSASAEKSFGCFLSAASKGNLSGIYWVGRSYLYGNGVEKDMEKAKTYLKTAMKKGHVYARLDYRAAQIRGSFGGWQRIAGLLGSFKAIVMAIIVHRTDPYGDRIR